MAGYGANRGGLSGIIVGTPQVPVVEIGPEDIPIDRDRTVQYRKSAFERYNYMSGQFTSIQSMFNPESLKPVTVNADIAEDGRRRQATNDFLQVTDPDIAQYLLNIRYRQNRVGGTATLPVSRRIGLAVREGEWVEWNGRTWMIQEKQIDNRFRFTFILSETSADIYDDGDIDPGPIVVPPVAPVNPSLLFTIQNFNIDAGIVNGADGYDVPVLRFTWTPPADPTITAVRIFYRIEGTLETFEETCTTPEIGEYTTTKNVVSNKVYQAQATITTVPDRLKTLTPWVTSARATGVLAMIAYLSSLGEDAKARLQELQARLDSDRSLFERFAVDLSLNAAVADYASSRIVREMGEARAELRQESLSVVE